MLTTLKLWLHRVRIWLHTGPQLVTPPMLDEHDDHQVIIVDPYRTPAKRGPEPDRFSDIARRSGVDAESAVADLHRVVAQLESITMRITPDECAARWPIAMAGQIAAVASDLASVVDRSIRGR